MTPKAHIVALEEQRRMAMLAGDGAALRALFAADLRYGHSTGAVDTHDSLLSRLTAGEVVYRHLAFEQLVVTMNDDAAIVSGEMHATICKAGEVRQLASRYQAVWLRRGGTWQFCAFQSSKLP